MNVNASAKSLVVVVALVVLFGCTGSPKATVKTGGSSPSSSFTIGGTVAGLTGTGLVLQDNGGDNLTITITGRGRCSTRNAIGDLQITGGRFQ